MPVPGKMCSPKGRLPTEAGAAQSIPQIFKRKKVFLQGAGFGCHSSACFGRSVLATFNRSIPPLKTLFPFSPSNTSRVVRLMKTNSYFLHRRCLTIQLLADLHHLPAQAVIPFEQVRHFRAGVHDSGVVAATQG